MSESSAKPRTAKDKAMSNRHVRETMNLQKKHLRDHRAASTKPGFSKTYNTSHAKVHQKEIAKRAAKLKSRKS